MTLATGSLPKSTTRNATDAMRIVLGGRRGLLALGATVLVFGLIFKWNWLVAAGIAPLLLSALPCIAMCALGLCMRKMSGSPSDAQTGAAGMSTDAAAEGAKASLLLAAASNQSSYPSTTGNPPANVIPITKNSCCRTPY